MRAAEAARGEEEAGCKSPARQQRLAQQQTSPPPGAAVLLSYALSDVAVECGGDDDAPEQLGSAMLAALQQLHGLPLLPVADGSSVPLLLSSAAQPVYTGLWQRQQQQQLLQNTVRRAAAAPSAPAAAAAGGGRAGAHESCTTTVVFVPCDDTERQLLSAVPDMQLHPGTGAALSQVLLKVAATGATNLLPLSCATLAQHVLPRVLPASWQGQDEVQWHSEQAAVVGSGGSGSGSGSSRHHHPYEAFVRMLWRWAASRSDVAELAAWPLLPVVGGALHALQRPARVLQGGDWTEGLLSGLARMNVRLLDRSALDLPCPSLAPFVQQPSAAGVLHAVLAACGYENGGAAAGTSTAAAAVARRQQASDAQIVLSPAALAAVDVLAQRLTAGERGQLRSFLLQACWFENQSDGAGVTAAELELMRALPIYEVHAPLPHELLAEQQQQALQQAQDGWHEEQEDEQQQQYNDQQQQHQQLLRDQAEVPPLVAQQHAALVGSDGSRLLLPPRGMPAAVLGRCFVRCTSEAEEALLQRWLLVTRMGTTDFLRHHLVAASHQLPRAALLAALSVILSRLPELTDQEPELPGVLGCDNLLHRDVCLSACQSAGLPAAQCSHSPTPHYHTLSLHV